MPDTIWCYEKMEKSLENVSRDFFASGTKTLVLLPEQRKNLENDAFVDYIGKVLGKLKQIGQEITVIGHGNWPFKTVTRSDGRYVFKDMPLFQVKRRNMVGRFSVQDEVLPSFEKVGLINDFCQCDNVVLIGCLHSSSRFGVTSLMSLVENVLPTYSLSQAYMKHPQGTMNRSLAEVISAKIYPKVALSIVWNENGVVLGRDMVAVESVALKNASVNLRSDKLILESVKLDFGDILLQKSFIEGSFEGRKPKQVSRINAKPAWKKDLCNLCLDCLDVCPNGSLSKNNNLIVINSNCVRCGACADCCNINALI